MNYAEFIIVIIYVTRKALEHVINLCKETRKLFKIYFSWFKRDQMFLALSHTG